MHERKLPGLSMGRNPCHAAGTIQGDLMPRRLFAILIPALLCVTAAHAADDFYEDQLQNAKTDLAAGRTAQAGDELRIAAFGFLDRPPLLIEALVRLA